MKLRDSNLRANGSGILEKTASALLLGASALSLTSPAAAQEAQQADEAAAGDEIIVTAQRRSESAQDVPIALAVFGGEQLDKMGVNSVDDLASFVPGAQLYDDRGAGQPAWVIRGVGLADFNSNNTPTAAIHYDDFYLTSNVMGGVATFDVERVEVLKGPQGGLYGRNTTGGAVTITSRRPGLKEWSGYARASYGRWQSWQLEGAVGGPIAEHAGFRIAGQIDKGGGWQDSLATPGNDQWGDADRWGLRAQLLIEPSETVKILLKIDAGEDKSETTLSRGIGAYDPATGDFCAAIYAGGRDDANCVTLANLTNATVLTPGEFGLLPSAQDARGRRVLSRPINRLDNDWFAVQLRGDVEIGGATLSSISNYIKYDNVQFYDYDASPLRLVEELPGDAGIKSWSQELRLVSGDTGPLTWLVGALYAEDTIDERRDGDFSDNHLVLGAFFPPPYISVRSFEQDSRSWAIYGQLGYELSDKLSLNGSLRYTNEKRDLIDYTHFFGPPATGFPLILDLDKSYKLGANWSGHIGFDWKPNDDTLVYGKITRGYKSGGFFGGFALDPGEIDPYKEETVWSYELGFKSQPARGLTLNGAAYYYDYSDVQGYITIIDPLLGQTVTKLNNIGDARHLGAELDLAWRPAPGLTIGANAAWIDAKINQSSEVFVTEDLQTIPFKGIDRTFAPKFSYSLLARYETSLGSLDASAQLAYSWRDELVTRKSQGSTIDYALNRHPGYGLGNLRLGVGQQDKGWELAFLVDNLFDKKYFLRVTSDDLGSYFETPARPRSWTIEASFSF